MANKARGKAGDRTVTSKPEALYLPTPREIHIACIRARLDRRRRRAAKGLPPLPEPEERAAPVEVRASRVGTTSGRLGRGVDVEAGGDVFRVGVYRRGEQG